MAIQMVRQPSSQPNIENIDDIIPFRYAYGNQNGYVIGKGTEVGYTPVGNSIIINSGRIVVQGVEVDIDDSGVQVEIDVLSQKRYYVIYCKINMLNNVENGQVATIETTFATNTYPSIPTSEDLTTNTTGTAYLELYRFEATNGVISNIEKLIKPVEYTGTALVGYDISKGTIEERLTNLGFKRGNIIDSGGNVVGEIVRQGKMVSGTLNIKDMGIISNPIGLSLIFNIQEGNYDIKEFLPKNTIFLYDITDYIASETKRVWCAIRNDEKVTIVFGNKTDQTVFMSQNITFGYPVGD